MLTPATLESLYSATYVEDYLDGMENLPDDVQRKISQILELNVSLRSLINELESSMSYLMEGMGKTDSNSGDDKKKKMTYKRVQQILMLTQDIGDEKLQLGQQIQDLIENKNQQLNLDKKNIDFQKKQQGAVAVETAVRETKPVESEERPIKRARRARHEVFVPSILGPATLEATSFSQMSDIPTTSMSASLSIPSSSKSQTLAARQASPTRMKKDDVEIFSSPRPSKSEAQSTPSSTVVRASSTEPAASATSKAPTTSTKVTASRSLNFGTFAEATTSAAAAAQAIPVPSTSAKVDEETLAPDISNPPVACTKEFEWKTKSSAKPKKDKRGKKRRSSTKQPVNIPIDPDEPLYCLCDQVSYGEMIGCDNDLCPIEWFHFSCVSLTTKPKGKWFCPKCRGDRPNVMKPKAIFLKELAIYNRLKEESN